MKTELVEFVVNSNAIEGILRDPTDEEIFAHDQILSRPFIDIPALESFVVACIKRESPLRDRIGMDVRVGVYLPPAGGHLIRVLLTELLNDALVSHDPYEIHCRYETLHPFIDGNGRSGRVLWLWHMLRLGRNPYGLSFLHRWYYDSLSHYRHG